MLESIKDQYQQIGHIARSHGVQGEVLVIPDRYAPTLFDSLDLVHITNTRGDLIPARIESVRVQEKGNRQSFFVKFEHISDRTEAEELKQEAIYIDRNKLQNGSGQVDGIPDFNGFEILVKGKLAGEVKRTITNPAHPILQVSMTNGESILIPCVDEYIRDIDVEQQQFECQNLHQLEDL